MAAPIQLLPFRPQNLVSPEEEGIVFQIIRSFEKSSDINATDINDSTALHRAAKNGHIEVVRFLLQNKAKVELTDQSYRTPLCWAVFSDHLEVVSLLLDYGADVNNIRQYTGPLHEAVRYDRLAIAELLIARGADVHARSFGNGQTALDLAAKKGHQAMIQLLTQAVAKVDAIGSVAVAGLFSQHAASTQSPGASATIASPASF